MPSPEHTASAASRVHPPANTESRLNNVRSASESKSWLQSSVALRVRCLGAAVRLVPLSKSREHFEPLGDLLHRQRSHPCRGELYGKRYPVEFPAHPRYGPSVLLGHFEVEQPQTGAVDEEPDRLVAHQALEVSVVALHPSASGRERGGTCQRTSPSTPRGSRLVASTLRRGHEARSASTKLRRRLHEVLAVVEHQQHLFARQGLHERVGERLARALPHPQAVRHLLGTRLPLGEGR